MADKTVGKSVLITGATGFLGEYLVRRLVGEYRVLALGRNQEKGRYLEGLGAEFCPGDFTDEESCGKYFKGIHYVIHGGALSTVWGEWEDFYKTNVRGTDLVAKLCLKNKVCRMVYISSPSIYTGREDQYDIREEQAPENNDLNYYIKSKIMAEKRIRKWNAQGLETVVLRPRGLIGIGDTSLVPRLLRANGGIGIPLLRGGKNLVDLTSVENVAFACQLAMTAEGASGKVFNITNGEPAEFRVLLEKFLKAAEERPHYRRLPFGMIYGIAAGMEWVYRRFHLKGEPTLTRYTACTLGFSQTMDIRPAQEILGYCPKKNLEEAIVEYGRWWRDYGKKEGEAAGNTKKVRGRKAEEREKVAGQEKAAGQAKSAEHVNEVGYREFQQKQDQSERKRPGKIKRAILYHCGSCTNNLAVIFRKMPWEKRQFPAAVLLIEHKDFGNILYDTGYSERIFGKGFLLSLYRRLNPVCMKKSERIDRKLLKDKISPESVKTIILSHAHPDHVGGLSLFSDYELMAFEEVLENLKNPHFCHLVFSSQLPKLKEIRIRTVSERKIKGHFLCQYFDQVYDLFGDGSIFGVKLDGHCKGQMGVWIPDMELFLAADACWGKDLIRKTKRMRWIPRLIQEDFKAYQDTLERICRMKRENPKIQIIFSHDRGKEKVYAGTD